MSSLPPRPRKLLLASVGVATILYAGCESEAISSGNLMAPPPCEEGQDPDLDDCYPEGTGGTGGTVGSGGAGGVGGEEVGAGGSGGTGEP